MTFLTLARPFDHTKSCDVVVMNIIRNSKKKATQSSHWKGLNQQAINPRAQYLCNLKKRKILVE